MDEALQTSILFVSPRKNRYLLDDRLKVKKMYLFISLYTFSISHFKWRNEWSISPSILFVSPRKNQCVLDDCLTMKKSIYLYLSIPFPFLLLSGETDEAFYLIFHPFLLEKIGTLYWVCKKVLRLFFIILTHCCNFFIW
jgi:hypothetical protein